jgi:hypothetical protein
MVKKNTILKITGDSGFIAIVNTDKYKSFVDENWELPQLFNHFTEQMNNENLIIWATGSENEWTVNFLVTPSNNIAFREFNKSITVTSAQLYLTNYEDLTMAAQFDDCTIPAKHNSSLYIKLENGKYNFTTRQMFDPKDESYRSNKKGDFEIIIRRQDNIEDEKASHIFWL